MQGLAMLLETRIDEEIRRAIFLYKEICKDPANISGVDPKYMGENRRMEFVTDFIRAGSAKEREKRARLEKEAYAKIKNVFAQYIGMKLLKKLELNIDIPEEAMTLLGTLFIDSNYNNV